MASATLCGSSQSTGRGLPVATAQNPQLRVQMFPRIIKVAVPAPQHSPIFGQLPLSQIVWSLYWSTRLRTCLKFSPIGSLTRSQFGFLLRGSVVSIEEITGSSCISYIVRHKVTLKQGYFQPVTFACRT